MYDVVIVGCGVSGLFLALSMATQKKIQILMIDKGAELKARQCPKEKNDLSQCASCVICDTYSGIGGLGKSEGKYNYSLTFGGNLAEKIGSRQGEYYLQMVDNYLTQFGGKNAPCYSTHSQLNNDELNIKILTTRTRHLGTKLSVDILENMYSFIKQTVKFNTNQTVINIEKHDNAFTVHTNESSFMAKTVVLATGNSGSGEFQKICASLDIPIKRKRIDLGLRVEMTNTQFCEIFKNNCDIKLQCRDDERDCITHCMNPRGRVIKRIQDTFTFTDGQNCREFDSLSNNSNFAILVSHYFTPEKADAYCKHVMAKLNKKSGRLIVQRLGDVYANNATLPEQLQNNSVVPSLDCESGNLHDVVPRECIQGAVTLLSLLQKMSDTIISEDTLLYGLDAKIYQPEVELDQNFQSHHPGLFIIGDCSGSTSSLSHAAASGIFLGEHLTATLGLPSPKLSSQKFP